MATAETTGQLWPRADLRPLQQAVSNSAGLPRHLPGAAHVAKGRLRRLNYLRGAPEGLMAPEHPLLVPSVAQLAEEGYDSAVIDVIRRNWRFIACSYRTGPILKR